MRNLLVLSDHAHCLQRDREQDDPGEGSFVSCFTVDFSQDVLMVLNCNGMVYRSSMNAFYSQDGSKLPPYICRAEETAENDWFSLEYVDEISCPVGISHTGTICTLENGECEQQGVIEGGISAAQWSPDYGSILIATNNDSLLSMTSSWDVLNEVPLEPKVENSSVCISWRGDGEYVAVYSVDKSDGIGRVRIFNRDLELHAISRQVGEGAAADIKGLVPAVAFANNGGLVAVGQQKGGKNKPYVCLLEKNGLKHGEIEIQCPPGEGWVIECLHWDLPSNLLAVTLTSVNASSPPSLLRDKKGVVQLYYRNNYHWYCKQCWSGNSLKCMGFDKETMDKLYLSLNYENKQVLRVIELVWDIVQSWSTDCTTAVIDGNQVLLTPVAWATVPPPMSKYQVTMPSFVRYISFWNRPDYGCGFGGMVCLCESDRICICFSEDDKGQPSGQVNMVSVDVSKFIKTLETSESGDKESGDVFTGLRSAIVVETKYSDNIELIVTATPLNYMEGNDALHIFTISRESWKVLSHSFQILQGVANRIVSWPNTDEKAVGIGVISKCMIDNYNYEVYKISLETKTGTITNGVDVEMSEDTRVGIFPEICVSIVIAASSGQGNHKGVICFGLSIKNKLYVGELLMKSGVNSFALNAGMDMLMYVTVGTRPHLHFCSLEAISQLDPLMFENNYLLPIECALPRPLERGARLVATIQNNPKVVIQLPRGNIEAFEPRPLILIYACRLLDANDFYNCLILLRRQKVDLNFVIDYNAQNFLDNIESMVSSVIQKNNGSDLLGLLISSLDDYDSTVTKYIIPGVAARCYPESFLKEGKINSVCTALRNALSATLPHNSAALNPLLCTLARQKPPLLIDALKIIRSESKDALQSSKCTSTLKYLAFLANNEQIFNAALEDCDFLMATSIARISQMDPKIYIPLIESFETIENYCNVNAIGAKLGEESREKICRIFNCFMRYKIHIHLKKFENGVIWCLQALKLSYEFVATAHLESEAQDRVNLLQVDEFRNVQNDLFLLIRDNDIFISILPLLRGILINLKLLSGNFDDMDGKKTYGDLLVGLYSKLQVAYGRKCCSALKYDEAIASFLSTYPPSAEEAVNAARMNNDWKTAIAIAGRYADRNSELNPKTLVQELISDYRETLEQAEYDEGDDGCGNFPYPSLQIDPLQSWQVSEEVDFPMEASKLCLSYLDDTDGAVSILLMSHKWIEAINLAINRNRFDLLSDDIYTATTDAAKQLSKQIMKRGKLHLELVTELSENVWKDRELRLQNVSTTEVTLAAILNGESEKTENVDDQGSEFTADTRYSQSSFVSNLSSQLSNSMMSAQSNASGLSTVSILSHNTTSVCNTEDGDFSIKGLDHGLLSRGTGDGSRKNVTLGGKKEKKEKKQRHRNSNRQQRGEGRSEGKDVWGLRNELNVCDKLLQLVNVRGVSRAVERLAQALLVLSENNVSNANDCALLASQLQEAMDEYVSILESKFCSIAPSYPFEWLKKRNMTVIRHFQSPEDVKDVNILLFNQLIENGIETWKRTTRRVALSAVSNMK